MLGLGRAGPGKTRPNYKHSATLVSGVRRVIEAEMGLGPGLDKPGPDPDRIGSGFGCTFCKPDRVRMLVQKTGPDRTRAACKMRAIYASFMLAVSYYDLRTCMPNSLVKQVASRYY
jgi:hypothetical protein